MQWANDGGITIAGAFLFQLFILPYFSYSLSSFLIRSVDFHVSMAVRSC
jgi:hypothetical protein